MMFLVIALASTRALVRALMRILRTEEMWSTNPSNQCSCWYSITVLLSFDIDPGTRPSAHRDEISLQRPSVPSIMVDLSAEDYSSKVSQLVDLYKDDLPSPTCIESELHCWQMKWEQYCKDHGDSSLPRSPTITLKHATTMFPNIRALVSILCTLPVTSCSAERSFSGIKTAVRSSMTTERLTGLSLLHIHRDIPVNIDVAIDEFCRHHPRRMQMVDLLEDWLSLSYCIKLRRVCCHAQQH